MVTGISDVWGLSWVLESSAVWLTRCLMVDAKTFSWAVSWNSCRWPLHVAWASWQQGPSVSRASAYRERKEETEGALSGSYLTL